MSHQHTERRRAVLPFYPRDQFVAQEPEEFVCPASRWAPLRHLGARLRREVTGAVGVGDGDDDHRGHVAPARQELSDAGGVVEVGVTVEQVHHGVLLLASLVALRQVDDELPVLSQHVRVKLPGGSDDVG